jgi:hypothetical protein
MISKLKGRLAKTFTNAFWINWLQATVYGIGGLAFFSVAELIVIWMTGNQFGGSLIFASAYITIGAFVGLWVLNKKRDRNWIYGALSVVILIIVAYLAMPAGTQELANMLLLFIPLGAVLGPRIWKK